MSDLASQMSASLLSFGRGLSIRSGNTQQPEKMLKMYEMEGCPYCRVVREVLTELDIDVLIVPCPKGNERNRSEVRALGGKEQFPFLVDPNTDHFMYESADIIEYLYQQYGSGSAPSKIKTKAFQTPAATLASAVRAGRGVRSQDAKTPEEPLVLYSFEASPFARRVRERLCEYGIPYVLKNMGRGQWQDYLTTNMRDRWIPDYQPSSRNRVELQELLGFVVVPYLVDPNTGMAMTNSRRIMSYLKEQYGTI